jgi:chaperone required for assembly of F1-ATPase
MTGWSAKRFWTAAEVRAAGPGWEVALDGRPVRTPAKTRVVMPTRAMAQAVAAEWAAQQGKVDPRTMPVTRAVNAALDKVPPLRPEMVMEIAGFGDADLICYRAEAPERLRARQAAAWDPLADWAAARWGVPLRIARGIVHVPQDATLLAAMRAEVAALDDFRLVALSDLVAMSGSLVIGLMAAHGAAAPEDLWAASRVDEDWQAEEWGADEEAAEVAALKRADFLQARRFWDLAAPGA